MGIKYLNKSIINTRFGNCRGKAFIQGSYIKMLIPASSYFEWHKKES